MENPWIAGGGTAKMRLFQGRLLFWNGDFTRLSLEVEITTRSHAHVLCILICIPNFLRMRFVSHSGCLFEGGICVLACGWTCDKIFHRERKRLNVLGNSIGYGYQAENIVEKIQNWGLQNTQRYNNITYTQTHFYACVFVFLFFRGTNFLTNIRCKGMFTVQNKLPTSVACYQFPQLCKTNQNSFYSNALTNELYGPRHSREFKFRKMFRAFIFIYSGIWDVKLTKSFF